MQLFFNNVLCIPWGPVCIIYIEVCLYFSSFFNFTFFFIRYLHSYVSASGEIVQSLLNPFCANNEKELYVTWKKLNTVCYNFAQHGLVRRQSLW